MIKEDREIKKEEAKIYPPIPKNIYQVELLDIDEKDAVGKFAKEGDKNFVFQFTLLAGKDKEQDLRGRNVWDNFVPTSLYIGKNGKCSLWQIVEAFLARDLTPQEQAEGLNGKLLNSFIGNQIKIFVDHKLSGEKIFNKITSYMPAESLLPSLTDDEKDKARVKKQEEPKEEEVNVQDIPF
jgi:hypothetical protein